MNWLIPIVSFLGSALGVFLISFVREKGKNYATKSDIGKITETIESIKLNYTKEQETLKAQLSLIVNTQNSLHADIKRAIYEFWDSMFLLLSLCDTTRSEVDDERVADLQNYGREIERVENELVLKQARLFFLIEDEKLIELSDELLSNVTILHGKFSLFLIKAQPWLEKMSDMDKQVIWDKAIYNSYWQEVLKLETEFDKETEEVADKIDINTELFKKRAHELLSNTKMLA